MTLARVARRLALALVLAVLVAGGGWLAITSLAPGPWVATWAPCPRNWGWTPAWQSRASPLDSVAFRLADGSAKLCYGRPSLRGRTMLGGEAVPWGELWRTGANEATTLHTNRPFTIGDLSLPAGSYALYTIPRPERWEILVNTSTRQWGIEPLYPEAREIGRFEVPAEELVRPVETLTVSAEPAAGPVRELVLEWQRSRVRIPLASPPS